MDALNALAITQANSVLFVYRLESPWASGKRWDCTG